MHIYMHKTLFFIFEWECMNDCIKLFSLFYISFKMYFQNSSYVIECNMDAFEDVRCMCECMMYVMICDACLDVWWMSKCMLYIYKVWCMQNVCMSIIFLCLQIRKGCTKIQTN